jgi:hypothetical protein
MKFAGWYGIVVGLLMLGMWSFFLANGQVPELQTEPIRIYFHLAAEFTTAIGLLFGGLVLLRKLAWSRSFYFLPAGMALYSLVVSPGYYAQQGQWGFVVMFAILIVLTLVSVIQVARSKSV